MKTKERLLESCGKLHSGHMLGVFKGIILGRRIFISIGARQEKNPQCRQPEKEENQQQDGKLEGEARRGGGRLLGVQGSAFGCCGPEFAHEPLEIGRDGAVAGG